MNKHILTVNVRIVYKVIIKRLKTKRKFEQPLRKIRCDVKFARSILIMTITIYVKLNNENNHEKF